MKIYRILIVTFFAYTLISCGGAEERKSVYMEKAKASIGAGDFDKARIELKNVLQIDPKYGEAYYQIGYVYEQQKEYRKAYGNYLKAEELSPELLANHTKLGRLYLLLMNDTVKAQEKVDLVLSKEPDNADGLLLKAAVALRSSKPKEAIAIAEDIVTKNPNHIESITFLAALYLKDKKITDAIDILSSGIKNNHNSEQLNRYLAAALVKNKEYSRAEKIFITFLDKNPDNSVNYNTLAAFYSQADNQMKAEETLRASINNNPTDVDRILTLIKYIIERKGDTDAIKELKAFIADNQGLGKLRVALGELFIISGDKQAAANIYKQAVAEFSEEEVGVISRLALAKIYIGENDFDKASKVIEEVILISPNDPKVNMLRAKLAVRDKDTEKATIALRLVTKEDPENIDAYILLASIYLSEKNKEQAQSVMNTAYNNNKGNAKGLLTLAQYYYTRDIQQAKKVINDYNSIKPSDYDGLSMKAAILNQNKNHEEAKEVAELLMEIYPKKSNGYLQAVQFYINEGDKSKTESILEKGYLNAEDNSRLLDLLTTIQVSNKKFDIVEKRIKAELAEKPNDPKLKILLAKVYVANEDIESAIKLFSDVVDSNVSFEQPYLLLTSLYLRKKDIKLSEKTLIKGMENVTSSVTIPMTLANVYEQEEKYLEAINVYSNLHDSRPADLLVINNMVSLLSDHGSGARDLELVKSLLPVLEKNNQPVFSDTVGWAYYKLGDSEKAIQNLEKAIEKMPEINVFNYHLGMAYKMSGDKTKAKVFLEKSLDNKKPFKEKALAEKALKKL